MTRNYIRAFTTTNTTGFRIALFNAQSVGSSEKRAEISTFVTDTRIDLFFITETWLNHRGDEAKIAELAPSGYSAHSFPRRSRGGGLAVIFRDTLSTNLTFKTKFDFDHSSFELIQVSVTLQTSALHFLCMYRPPPSRKNKLTDSLFSEQFPDLIDTCNSLRGQICILGDMNIHYDCPDHPLTSKTLDLLYMYNFKQVVTQSTHRRGHILDCIIIRPSDQIHLSSEVTDSLESDHLCVMSCFDVSVARSCPVYRYVRNIRGIDRSAFVADLETELVGIGHSLSADQYNVTLLSVLDKHAPAAKSRVTERMSSPWFGLVREDLLEAKRSRRQAERKWRNSNLTVFKDLYKKAKHHVTNVVLKAKKLYYNSKISSANCSKELYKITNNILARTKQVHLPTTYPLSSLPELFSNYFSDKIMKIRNELDSQAVSALPAQADSFSGFTLSTFEPVTEAMVKLVITKSAPKTCSLDPIPTPLLLEILDCLLPSLTALINSSLSSGLFPPSFQKCCHLSSSQKT